MKTDMIYSDDTLFIYLEGSINKKEIKKLKLKMDNIINEYQINDVIINTKNMVKTNDIFFNNLVNEYKKSEVIIKKIWQIVIFKYNIRTKEG